MAAPLASAKEPTMLHGQVVVGGGGAGKNASVQSSASTTATTGMGHSGYAGYAGTGGAGTVGAKTQRYAASFAHWPAVAVGF